MPPTANEIRQQFIDYFVDKAGHTAVPSSPVVPHDDPTLLFTNAGMNQFKDVFLGQGNREYVRAVDTQKCIRAGGKHNDLDDVGKDTYHHTFFEMLGNWSLGDYFKAEAIDWAWDLLVNVWGLDPNRLHATYFEGDVAEDLEPDEEARELWLKYLPAERIHPGNKKDNFWEMGDTGPCGPCSEIHYDRTPDFSGAKLVNADDPRVIEIWNLVFIQFNRGADSRLTPLPAKHVDTGMGYERIVAVLQGKDSNYDTDVFAPLFEAIREATGAAPYTGELEKPEDVAYRVIADHIRCLTFALTDGAHCSNEGRGYVLRRILRRAVRYGRQTLGVQEPFFYKLVPAVVDTMGDAFPELKKNPDAVAAELQDEEDSFGKTLDRGIALFDEAADRAKHRLAGDAKRPRISAEDAFQLHDTYGFPLDLTQLMAEERGMTVDVDGFNRLMEEARERSRGEGGGSDARASLNDIVQQHDLPATEFVGYDTTELMPTPMAMRIFRLDNNGGLYQNADTIEMGEACAVVVEKTPFYAEAGGQVGDTGVIQVNCGGRVQVHDTIKVGDVTFHLGEVVSGTLAGGDAVPTALAVDRERRAKIMANHTTTHVMNRALRSHVNPEADQRGSLVDPDKLRFDFSHGKAVTPEQIDAVEKQVNDDIAADLTVYAKVAPQDEAIKINGLRAVFGEKYPPKVRVVSIGVNPDDLLADPANSEWGGYSIEFCGGTHLPSTGVAEGFCFVGEEAVGKGVRRVTALTGAAAHEATAMGERLLNRVQALSDAAVEELRKQVDAVQREIDETTLPLSIKARLRESLDALNKRIKEASKARGKESEEQVVVAARAIADESDGPVITARIDDADGKSILAGMDVIKKRHPESAILLAGAASGKVALAAAVPKPLIGKGLKAGDWVKHVAPIVGGGGGGRPDSAQAGGKDPGKIDEALSAAEAFATEKL